MGSKTITITLTGKDEIAITDATVYLLGILERQRHPRTTAISATVSMDVRTSDSVDTSSPTTIKTPLTELWLEPFVGIEGFADAAGLNEFLASNAVMALVTAYEYDKLPGGVGPVEIKDDSIRASDFVRLIGMSPVRKVLRAIPDNKFGAKTEGVALKLAHHLKKTYGQAA